MADLKERAIALADERLSAGCLDIEDWVPLIVALVRNETLEEAAKIAKGNEPSASQYYRGRVHAAAAIRALATASAPKPQVDE